MAALFSARRSHILPLVAVAALGAPLTAFATAGLFSRYAADDYCTAGQVALSGFVEAQSRLYVGWSGRFAATFLITVVELIGAVAPSVLPGLALLAWLLAAIWAVREVAEALGWRLGLLPATGLAAVIVFATLDTTADMPQVLYWQTGMLTYLSPLVLGTLFVGWVARTVKPGAASPWPLAIGVSCALTFFAGGTSETFAAAQVTALVLASITSWFGLGGARAGSRRLQSMLLAGLVGAVLALAIVAVAPGNEVRQESTSRSALSTALPQTVEFTRGWLRLTFARPHAIVLALLIGLPAVVWIGAEGAVQARATPLRWHLLVLAGVVVSTALVILASMLPAFYALGSNPPGRAQIIPQFVLVCSVAVLASVAGTFAQQYVYRGMAPALGWVVSGGLVLLLGLGPLVTAVRAFQQVTAARVYAAAWDRIDDEVRAARSRGASDVTVPPLAMTGTVMNLDFIGPNRSDWFNACVARYYGVGSIAAEAGAP